MTLKKFVIFQNTVSLYSGLIRLWAEGHYFLFVIIGMFSVIFPVCKNFLLSAIWYLRLDERTRTTALGWLEKFGPLSMLDVFVIALLVVVVELKFIADVEVHFGIIIFAVAILLSLFLSFSLRRLAE